MALSLREFIDKWDGRGIDFDGYYGDQCMDLMHQYHVEVLGITDGRTLAAPSAKEVFLKFDTRFNHHLFEKIDNTPTGVPEPGDIMLWGEGIGPWGHVAIFVDGDVNSFNSFDQNFPTGSKCHIQKHNYSGVLGWLRYKGELPKEPLKDTLIDWFDFEGNSHKVGWYVYEWEVEKKNNEKLSLEIAGKNKDYKTLQKTLAEVNQINTSLMKDKSTLIDEQKSLREQITASEGVIETISNDFNELSGDYSDLSDKLEQTKQQLSKYKKLYTGNLTSYSRWRALTYFLTGR